MIIKKEIIINTFVLITLKLIIMEKFIGKIKSEKSGIMYSVWWDTVEKTLWRDTPFQSREMIGYNVTDDQSAIRVAEDFLAQQI